ncbi:carotenoid oxygenase family protein [Gordonia alkanivorans]|uniref:carotenoid oxygenase family protein n=1 Tax=Gordonia alkanivorans TaxID=84096 RepID=UPI00244B02AF|nr:carotenoid oxygenase family protein [Gordonia alkanivorans]MDH3044325.1 carotenoid oxygenase family protein [Gordonia alkanivorans]MDH3052343.1 carotenoid oxygenase family protein [Gordonia alkanivorans]
MSVSVPTRAPSRETGGESAWDSQHEEFDYEIDDIEGQIPSSLRGVLFRIGPGRFEIGGHPMTHIFDGDGTVSRFDISPDCVHYRNRYVRTRSFKRANETQLPPKGSTPNASAGRWPTR